MISFGLILMALTWVYTRLRREHVALVSINGNFVDGWDIAAAASFLAGGFMVIAGFAILAWRYLP